MREITNEIKWFTETGQRIWETEGMLYLTLPDAVAYTNVKHSTLRQQIFRKKINVIKEDKDVSKNRYVFVPLEYCESIRNEKELTDRIEKIQKLKNYKITDEDLQRLIDWKESQHDRIG